jgi:hypothetical protein
VGTCDLVKFVLLSCCSMAQLLLAQLYHLNMLGCCALQFRKWHRW